MTAQLTASAVKITDEGIACAKCSGWENGRKIIRKHASVAAVRLCCTITREQGQALVQAVAAQCEANVDRAAQAIADGQAHLDRHPELVVPAGKYAVRGTDDVVRFYVVDHGKPGTKWEGRTFVSAQASDELHPVRNAATRHGILAAISVDVLEARKLYGRELGVCADCGRTLTSEWRKVGIGPKCSQK
jgi:hypothetical protein